MTLMNGTMLDYLAIVAWMLGYLFPILYIRITVSQIKRIWEIDRLMQQQEETVSHERIHNL
jgi:uncharacterized membrane protein YciS (DUF1049 family)